MTHSEVHDHPVRTGLLFFVLAAGALGWTTFVLWLMMQQLLLVIRG